MYINNLRGSTPSNKILLESVQEKGGRIWRKVKREEQVYKEIDHYYYDQKPSSQLFSIN